MKITNVLFRSHKSLGQLIDSIDWLSADNRYVIIDPNVPDHLLYVTESRYQKLISSSTDNSVKVLATPGDTRRDVLMRFGVDGSSPSSAEGTPHWSQWMSSNSKLFPLISGWKIKGSMIDFEGNFDYFFPLYYSTIISWLGMKRNSTNYREIWKLSKEFSRILKGRQINNLILYLKICLIAVNQHIAGTPLQTTQELGQRVKLINGLPKILPVWLRLEIRQRNLSYIRVIQSLLASYKAFSATWPKPSFGSITAPRYENPDYPKTFRSEDSLGKFLRLDREAFPELDLLASEFWPNFNMKNVFPNILPTPESLPLFLSAGPNHTVSLVGSGMDLLYHYFDEKQLLKKYIDHIKSTIKFIPGMVEENYGFQSFDVQWRFMEKDMNKIHKKGFNISYFKNFTIWRMWEKVVTKTEMALGKAVPEIFYNIEDLKVFVLNLCRIGKLATKFEAAGKVRVFAIGDYWTQWALLPLHESMFRVLRNHPCDATFDQLGKVEEFKSRGYKFIASYDLKSATDLIPQQLYRHVFSWWLGKQTCQLWLDLLVERKYIFFHDEGENTFRPEDFMYTRGQPMGILSSWSSLAIVHHFLVFYAAKLQNINNFRDYLVLGDDIVIANEKVARAYVLVCQQYGITIGFAKSFVSKSETGNTFFQFASQDMYGEHNISPISLKEVLAAAGLSYYFGKDFNLAKRLEFVNRIIRKGYINPTSISALIRCQSTPSEWKRDRKYLSNGIFPHHRQGLITSMLLNNYKLYRNTVSLDNLIASLRGDIRVFTNNCVLTNSQRRNYLNIIIKDFQVEIQSKLLKFNSLMVRKPLNSKDVIALGTYNLAMMSFNGVIAEDYVKMRNEWKVLSTRLASNAMVDQWNVLIEGTNSDLQEWPQDIIHMLDFKSRLERILIKVEIKSAVADCLDTKPPYLLRYHLSLLNSMIFKESWQKES